MKRIGRYESRALFASLIAMGLLLLKPAVWLMFILGTAAIVLIEACRRVITDAWFRPIGLALTMKLFRYVACFLAMEELAGV
jgi:hypothetical protein